MNKKLIEEQEGHNNTKSQIKLKDEQIEHLKK